MKIYIWDGEDLVEITDDNEKECLIELLTTGETT